MDFGFDLGEIAVKHSVEDGAAHCQHVLQNTESASAPRRSAPLRSLRPPRARIAAGTRRTETRNPRERSEPRSAPTLWAGTFLDAPGGPTMKWTSAMSSLLNISAFLRTRAGRGRLAAGGPDPRTHPTPGGGAPGLTSRAAWGGTTASWRSPSCCC